MGDAKRDNNMVVTLIGVSSADGTTPTTIYVDPVTHRVLTLVAIVVGTSPVSSGGGKILYDNAGTLGGVTIGTGLTFSGGTLSASASGLTVGTTTISGGVSGKVLYDNAGVLGELAVTGSGSAVLATSPTLVTPTLGAATATTINKVTITIPATGSTLTIADGKTLTASNTLTFTGTDGSSVAFGTGGTVAYTNVATLSSLASIGTITTGTWNATAIAVLYGGTGQTTYTNGQLLIGNTTGNTLTKATLTGTANQVVVTNGGGSITLSLPQNIDTAATPQFLRIGLGEAASSLVPISAARAAAGAANFMQLYNTDTTDGNTIQHSFIADSTGVGASSGLEFVNFRATINTHDNATSAATLDFLVRRANVEAVVMTLQAGVQIGSPTGGDKGAGTLNCSADVYKNGSAYTNPDYALELWATGKITKYALNEGAKDYRRMSLSEIEDYARANLRLPRIDDESTGIFKRADIVLEKIEEIYTYLFEMNRKLATLYN